MRNLNERAPEWLRSAKVVGHWSGLRARPVDRPAPLLEELEPGLILPVGTIATAFCSRLAPPSGSPLNSSRDHLSRHKKRAPQGPSALVNQPITWSR